MELAKDCEPPAELTEPGVTELCTLPDGSDDHGLSDPMEDNNCCCCPSAEPIESTLGSNMFAVPSEAPVAVALEKVYSTSNR